MRTRPFLLQPVYRGGPLNRIEEFFCSQLKKYRENNKVFNEFLNDIRDVIIARKLDYCGNILLFIVGQPRGNWVCAGRSFFSMFIKLFNYDFSDEQAVDYIENCYQVYKRIMTTDYTLDKEYTVYQKRSRWSEFVEEIHNTLA